MFPTNLYDYSLIIQCEITVKHVNDTEEFRATNVIQWKIMAVSMAVLQMDLSGDTLFDVLAPYCYYFTEYEMTQ